MVGWGCCQCGRTYPEPLDAIMCDCVDIVTIVDEKEIGMFGQDWIEETEESGARARGPAHYKDLPFEPWDIMDANFGEEQFEGFLRGNVLKYVLRYPVKGGVSDLVKARHYIDRLIELKGGD